MHVRTVLFTTLVLELGPPCTIGYYTPSGLITEEAEEGWEGLSVETPGSVFTTGAVSGGRELMLLLVDVLLDAAAATAALSSAVPDSILLVSSFSMASSASLDDARALSPVIGSISGNGREIGSK